MIKNLLYTFVILTGLTRFACPAPAADCVPAPDGVVAWWRAEGNALDSVATNHGTLVNGAAFAQGQVGQAFSFDGANAFLSVPDSTAWDLGTNDFTIELW